MEKENDLKGPFSSLYGMTLPHLAALGIRIIEQTDKTATMKLPYRRELIGNPETGVLHGGAVTTLIDTVCGLVVVNQMPKPVPVATLDLRIDYLKPALPELDLFARAECYKLTRQIAFTRSVAYQTSPDDPVAHAVGTFMVSRPSGDKTGERS